ncbi:hypothetical protein F5148DRAFT_1282521 [Russula earlei]|uniref:Uncharacterized protein n=1 Tax=Russula earlei TaxID=71964 RepID=A0ACC0UFM3_9AGAM|nr:hypothetical protein F5148DRAFT_1282521 [Russula earlei]
MDPSSSSIVAAATLEARGVRFDDECVLIPDRQPRSRVPKLLAIAKPASFIFKRKPSQDLPSPDHDAPQPPPTPRSAKHSLNDGNHPPPPIQRRLSLPPPSRSAHHARLHSLPHTPLVTIPLRPCCPDCFSATESAALQGESWTENFTRSARRRRSASTDNRPCPPHLLADSGKTIKWSSESPPIPFHSVVVVDKADHDETGLTDDDPCASDEGSSEMRNRLDLLSVEDGDPVDDILPPLLSRHDPWLSPIPSNNPSADHLPPTSVPTEEVEVDNSLTDGSPAMPFVSPPASPLPETPSSSAFSTPASSPMISSPPRPKERDSSPRIPGSFRIPKGATLMRAGSDILKGVSVLGSGPI